MVVSPRSPELESPLYYFTAMSSRTSCFTVLSAYFLTDQTRVRVPTSGVAVDIDTGGTLLGKVMKMT